MSLQVWLPLVSDFNNQGVYGSTITNTSVTLDNSGKLGKCGYFNGSAYLKGTINPVTWTEYSVACWVKPPTASSGNKQILSIATNSGWANNRASLLYRTSSASVVAAISDGTNSTQYNMNMAVTENDWNHIVVTYSNKTLKFYLNGIYQKSYTTTFDPKFSDITAFGVGAASNGAEKFTGYINDARIYDHALSAKEVREISKGLIAHYPLDGNGKSRDNYFINSNFYTGTTSNWGGVNGSTISIVSKDNKKCITGTKGTSSYLFCQTLNNYSYTAGTVLTYTISLDVYVEETGTIEIHNWITTTQASGWQGMSLNKKWNSGPSLVVGWNHVSVTMSNAKHDSYSGNIITGFSYSGTTMYATNIKFEFGNIDTPWCPNSADSIYTTLGYNNTIEYDTSGYKNNGTRTNIEVSNANSPKYSAASYFKGSSYIACGRNTMVTDAITINVWVYSSNWTNYVQTLASCTESGGWSFGISGSNFNWYMGTGTSSNTYKTISIAASTFTAGWHMITVTYDGLAVKGYVDAVLKGTNAAYTEKTPIFYNASNGVFIGAEAGGNQTTPAGSYSTCNMSDFRIYATALSVDDVLELYQTSASVTNNGAVMCYEFNEE